MKKFVKNYIGKGKKVEGLEIIKINFKVEDLVKFSHKYKGEDYISIEIAKLKSPDQFGHNYTAYVNRLEESKENDQVSKSENPKKKGSASKKVSKKVSSEDFPF